MWGQKRGTVSMTGFHEAVARFRSVRSIRTFVKWPDAKAKLCSKEFKIWFIHSFITCWSQRKEGKYKTHKPKNQVVWEWWKYDCSEKDLLCSSYQSQCHQCITLSSYATSPHLAFWFSSDHTWTTCNSHSSSLKNHYDKIKAAMWLVVQGNQICVNSWVWRTHVSCLHPLALKTPLPGVCSGFQTWLP